ncbi:hypothetical protein [Saccharothrix stipae]
MADQPIDPDRAVTADVVVTARTAQGDPHGSGRVIAYCETPTFIIERPDGARFSWRADMTFEGTVCGDRHSSGSRCRLAADHVGVHVGPLAGGRIYYDDSGNRLEGFWANTKESARA